LTLLCLAAAVVRADVGRPPAGERFVTPVHVIETDRELPDYVFVARLGSNSQRAFRVTIRPGFPARVSDPAREHWQGGIRLYAVPKSVADQCPTEQDLRAVVDESQQYGVLVEGSLHSAFDYYQFRRPAGDPRTEMVVRHRIATFDPAAGVFTVETIETDAADPGDPHERAVRMAVAGVAATAALAGFGLWLVGRKRGPVVQ